MKTYILAIAGIVLLSAVVSVIAPSGKMGKFIKGAMRLAILVVLISPFANWIGGKQLSIPTASVGEDSNYLQYCAKRLSEEDEKAIEKFLQQEFSVIAEVEVTRTPDSNFKREKISAKISDFGIIGQDEHIDMIHRIQETLQTKYGCPTEVA